MAIVEYYGLSSFAVEHGTERYLVDPWVSDPDWIDLEPDAFDDVDTIFVTHGAPDHLGDTYAIAERSGADVVTEPAVATHLVDRGLPEDRVRRVIWGNRYTDGGLTVQALETRHLSYFESGDRYLSGMPLGFYFGFGDADRGLYYVGDTSLFSDLELFVTQTAPDTVLLPVGSAPGDLAPLPPRDAARAASWLETETVVPVHYVPGSGEVDEFRAELTDLVSDDERPEIRELDVGDRFEV
jgi:L-ascorbate metabolism protein UlaG (beta-lactamase superfamily)